MKLFEKGTLLFLPEALGVLEPGLYELRSHQKEEKVLLVHDDGEALIKKEYLKFFLNAHDPGMGPDIC